MNWFATHTIALAIGICLGVFSRGVYFRKHCAGELNIFYRDGIPYLSLALNSFDALSRKNWAGFRIVRLGLPRD